MNSHLKNLSDQALMTKTETLVKEERELLTSILHHLREIERRRLFSVLGYKSLFDFTVRKLGYSEDQAYRRINAMKMLKEIPELEEKINSGKLSLMHISVAQNFFRQEEKLSKEAQAIVEASTPVLSEGQGLSKEEKLQILETIENTSIRQAERITLSLSSASYQAKPDRIKSVTQDQIEIRFQASVELQKKIERLKGLLAHKHPEISLGELFEKLCDLGISEFENKKRGKDKPNLGALQKRRVRKTSVVESNQSDRVHQVNNDQRNPSCRGAKDNPSKTAEPSHESIFGTDAEVLSKAEIKRRVWRQADSQCEFCQSTYALEIDHRIPRAKNGSEELGNLRLLCRNCNQRSAIDEFGLQKMNPYIN